MTKLALNKSELNQQKNKLQTYERFLPALELKQQQLMAEKKRAESELRQLQQARRYHRDNVANNLPMLGCADIHLNGMVKVKTLLLGEDYVVGVAVPCVEELSLDVVEYGFLSKPHWVDRCIDELKAVTMLAIKLQVQQERVKRLEEATRSATQRVNLFSKILIPEAKANIRKIRVFLSDMDTAAVVRSKMTKQKSKPLHQGADG